jgi:hypothetical protein
MTDTTLAKIQEQLRILLQLTQTEAQIAQTRVGQARTEAVRRELVENGRNAEERARRIADALREVGGYPDVVTPVVGRVTAFVKTTLEQVEPLSEALLQDLQLEHQLVDRARYVKVLATAADRPAVVRLAERLVEAHTATVEWLTTVLAEEALGGPAALTSTPLQRVAGAASRVVNLPNRVAVEGVNRYVNTVQRTAEQARTRVSVLGERAAGFADGAREVLTSAATRRCSAPSASPSATATATPLRRCTRPAATSALSTASELPIKNYEGLSTTDAIAAIKKLTAVEDVRTVIAFEEAHKARSSVVSAAQTRVAAIAKQVAGV